MGGVGRSERSCARSAVEVEESSAPPPRASADTRNRRLWRWGIEGVGNIGLSSSQVEQQYLRAFALFQDDLGRVGGFQCIACFKRVAIDRDLSAGHVNVGAASRRQPMAQSAGAVEEGRVQVGILVNAHR